MTTARLCAATSHGHTPSSRSPRKTNFDLHSTLAARRHRRRRRRRAKQNAARLSALRRPAWCKSQRPPRRNHRAPPRCRTFFPRHQAPRRHQPTKRVDDADEATNRESCRAATATAAVAVAVAVAVAAAASRRSFDSATGFAAGGDWQ